jgi:hypothetical protein
MTSIVVDALRQAVDLGYDLEDFFFAEGKAGPGAGWPDRPMPKGWERSHKHSLAIRLHHTTARLAAIDIDIADERMADAVFAAMAKVLPGLERCPVRGNTKNGKMCAFVRTTQRFGRYFTKHYKPDEDTPGQMVEAYGGGYAKYFVIAGAHDLAAGSNYEPVYMTDEDITLWSTPPMSLPEYTPEQIAYALDVATETMKGAGWYTKEVLDPNTTAGATLYDLDNTMTFLSPELDGPQTLDQLRAAAPGVGTEGLPVYMTFLAGRGEDMNPTRAIARTTHKGLLITELPDTLHYEVTASPPIAALLETRNIFQAALDQAKPQGAPARSYEELTGYEDALDWLMNGWAWRPEGSGHGIQIDPRAGHVPVKLQSLKATFQPWDQFETDDNGKVKRISPVSVWMSDPARVTVGGRQMRPDMPTPLFIEDRVNQLNQYYPPEHPSEGGETDTFHEMMRSMVPAKEERDWLLAQIAFKVQHPEIAGPGTVLVAADTYGTGRGTLFITLARLIGRQFCHQVDFGMLTGQNAGARFNGWQSENLVVTIEEAESGSQDGDTLRSRTAAFEMLKTKIEPNSQRVVSIEKKGVDQVKGRAFATFFIATNHKAAIRFPNETDRRLCVITCGQPMTPDLKARIYDWLDQPENIGALYRELLALDVSKTAFRPYDAPPMFQGKADMIEASKTDMDRLWAQMVEEYPSALFTPSIVVDRLMRMTGPKPQHWESLARRWTADKLCALGTFNDKVMVNGMRERMFARTRAEADHWLALLPAARQAEVRKGMVHDNFAPGMTPPED